MKLNRTRQEWAEIEGDYKRETGHVPMWATDLATLFAEVNRLTAQLAEREGIARELFRALDMASKEMTVRREIWRVVKPALARFHAAEGEGRKPHAHVTNKGTVLEIPEGVECPLCRIASAHAANGDHG